MSQKSRILEHMKRWGTIDPMTALDSYGCFRLAARIEELRLVHPIETEMVERGNKRSARYRLVK